MGRLEPDQSAKAQPVHAVVIMEMTMSLEPVWIVVADGGAARFFLRERAGVPLVEFDDLASGASPADQPAHKPFRAHDRFGHGGHTLDSHSSPHEAAERDFLRAVASKIDGALRQAGSDKLAIVAPPRALGILRDALSRDTRQRLICEIPKDVLHEPLNKIDERMKEHRI